MVLSNCVHHYDANSVYERKCTLCDGKGYQEGFGGGYWKTRCTRCEGTGIDSKTGAELNNEENKFIFNDLLRTQSARSVPG